MIEFSPSDSQTNEMRDFEYLFRLRESEYVPVIAELKKMIVVQQLLSGEFFSNCEF